MYNTNLQHAILSGANFKDAAVECIDSRGATGFSQSFLSNTLTYANNIMSDGSIQGLDLASSWWANTLIVRDYNAQTPIPITIKSSLIMGTSSILQMLFEEDAWDSKISFESGIPVTRGGTLELKFADGVDVSSQVGRTFSIFDWSGVNPTGTFNVSSPYYWNISNLYTTGEVTLVAVPEPSSTGLLVAGLLYLLTCRLISRKRCTAATGGILPV